MKAKKPKKPFEQYSPEDWAKYQAAFVKNTLRRASYRWPPRNMAAAAARVSRGLYRCGKCGTLVTNKDKKLDHISPVVDPQVGFVNWDVYAKRLFSSLDNFMVMCNDCHTSKTAVEREQRKLAKQKR